MASTIRRHSVDAVISYQYPQNGVRCLRSQSGSCLSKPNPETENGLQNHPYPSLLALTFKKPRGKGSLSSRCLLSNRFSRMTRPSRATSAHQVFFSFFHGPPLRPQWHDREYGTVAATSRDILRMRHCGYPTLQYLGTVW